MSEILCVPSLPTTSFSLLIYLLGLLTWNTKQYFGLKSSNTSASNLTGFPKSTADTLCHLHFSGKCRFPPYFSASHTEPEWRIQLPFVEIFWILMLWILFQNQTKVTSLGEPEFLLHRGSCYAGILSKEHQNLLKYWGRNKTENTFEITLICENLLPLSPPKHHCAFKAFFQCTPLSQNK